MGIIAPATILFPILAALVRFPALGRAARTVFVYLIVAGLVNTSATLMAKKGIRNLPLLHAFTLVEFVLVSFFYYSLFPRRRVILLVTMGIFALLCLVNSIFLQSIWTYNSYTRSLEAILICLLGVLYFLDNMEREKPHPIGANWFNTAFLLYFAGAFFLFLLSNLIVGNKAANTVIWNIHATLVLLMYLMQGVGFLKWKQV